ncbi:hypothetical protein G6F37_004447 [Rhizopus arrhizus]|nr:hypothetical protein G6F38_003394 [Rhizopus arrhizus]KAG1159935.1 hypothetical protein G6F37_004447 [Rhizopus arrhizus]
MSNQMAYLRNVPAASTSSPSGWTSETKYIDKLFWSPHVPPDLKELFQPSKAITRSSQFINQHVHITGTFPSIKEQRKHVKIKKITDPKHPCCGAYGLFAAQTLQPKQLIIDYLGVVEYEDGYESTSDYVLKYGTDLSIDAGRCGNEARFCNDFRGCGPEPNVCFMNYLDENTNHIKVGIFVNGNRKIKKGDELLVTYGKSFWAKRGIDMSHQAHKKSS